MPAPPTWRLVKALTESGAIIARLAHAVVEGVDARSRFASRNRPDRIVYPTRLYVENIVELALEPEDEGGYRTFGQSEHFPGGLVLNDVLREAADDVIRDEGDDPLVIAELLKLRDDIEAYATAEGVSIPAAAKHMIGGAHPDSLWWKGTTSALPDEPQTPGSPAWVAEEEKAAAQGRPAHHESNPNPF